LGLGQGLNLKRPELAAMVRRIILSQSDEPRLGGNHAPARRNHTPLRRAGGRGDFKVHEHAAAILHQRIPQKAQLGFLAFGILEQQRLRIGGALMGGVGALLPMEVH
jgi:hypothetical protein